ncbi:hypothetical protein N9924_00045 [bacterium]|nr:hypothetical protein [bacterium]
MNLDQTVREYLIENQYPEHRYFQALQFGISCLRELNLDVTGVPVTIDLPVSDSDTVDLPDDYINYVRIGTCDSAGNFHELGRNNNICLNRSIDDCGQPGERVNPDQPDVYSGVVGSQEYYSAHYRNGENIGRFYGAGGGQNRWGNFRIDSAMGQIQLAGYTGGDHLRLEYLGDPAKANGSFVVQPFALETVKAWIDWKMSSKNPSVPQNQVQANYNLYFRNKKQLRARVKSLSVQDLLQSFRKGNKQSPKF